MQFSEDQRAIKRPNKLRMAKDISDIISLDPAVASEMTAGEVIANVYERLLWADPKRGFRPGMASTWSVLDNGWFEFRLSSGRIFDDGRAANAEDVAFSFERVIRLASVQAFVLRQLGWTKDNVADCIKVVDPLCLRLKCTTNLSAGVVLATLSSGVASIVCKVTVLANQKNGDLGTGWLHNHSAGSGAYKLAAWVPDSNVRLDLNKYSQAAKTRPEEIEIRHIQESSHQLTVLRRGEADLVRDLHPEHLPELENSNELVTEVNTKNLVVYLGISTAHPALGDPKVWRAFRHLIDYKTLLNGSLRNKYVRHQSVLPQGMLTAAVTQSFEYNPKRAADLLRQVGIANDLKLRLLTVDAYPYREIAKQLKSDFKRVGITLLLTLGQSAEVWPRYRDREHDLVLGYWSPDYADPHAIMDSFAHNPDNDAAANENQGKVAWRNSWLAADITDNTERAAKEPDPSVRRSLYDALQRQLHECSPYIVMFRECELIARRTSLQGFVSGPFYDAVPYDSVRLGAEPAEHTSLDQP